MNRNYGFCQTHGPISKAAHDGGCRDDKRCKRGVTIQFKQLIAAIYLQAIRQLLYTECVIRAR